MLNDINPYVEVFRNAGNMLRDQGQYQDLRIKIIRALQEKVDNISNQQQVK